MNAPSALDNIVVVLCRPQKLVNIAGAIRAMKNMGLLRLRLVDLLRRGLLVALLRGHVLRGLRSCGPIIHVYVLLV